MTAFGNGRLDAVSNAVRMVVNQPYTLEIYTQHALEEGSTSKAASYVAVRSESGELGRRRQPGHYRKLHQGPGLRREQAFGKEISRRGRGRRGTGTPHGAPPHCIDYHRLGETQ